MLIKNKKLVLLLLALLLLWAFMPEAFAAPVSSQDQIVTYGSTRYYNSTGGEVPAATASLGDNAVVSVTKTIEGTDAENEFELTLDVKTSVDITEVKMSADAAAVLVLDVSNSMNSAVSSTDRTIRLQALKTAARNFIDKFADVSDGTKRYVSVVTFETSASIKMEWADITNPDKLTQVRNLISNLTAPGNTNMEGGLQLARNLLRHETFPNGQDGNPIENRSVILFSDGEANHIVSTAASNANFVGYSLNTTLSGSSSSTYARSRTETMANMIKNQTSFTANGKTYQKYDAYLFTVGLGTADYANWMRDYVATNPSFGYTASTAGDLNNVFAAIVKRIESWAEAWVVTDPMGQNIEFLTNIPQTAIDTGLLRFGSNTLYWDLKKASPNSFDGKIFTYTYTYRIRLNTVSSSYYPDIAYPTNGKTELTYVMVTDGRISSDVMIATFSVPSVRGYGGGYFDFIKVGDNTVTLGDCEFTLVNRTKPAHEFMDRSRYDTGAVSFANIPSGYTYTLTETYMPSAYERTYRKSTEAYTVTVSRGVVTIKDSKGNDVSNGFKFNNPLNGRKVTGLVSPMVVNDWSLGDSFLKQFDIVVELRKTFLTPASGNLKTTAVWTGTAERGQFTFEDVPFGEYVLYIKRPGYLVRCLPVSISASSPDTVVLAPPGSAVFDLWWGDVNDDWIIEVDDRGFILEKLNVDVFDVLRYNPACDLNADGVIDADDVAWALENNNKSIFDYPGAENINIGI